MARDNNPLRERGAYRLPVPDATVEGVQALQQQKFAMQRAAAKVEQALR